MEGPSRYANRPRPNDIEPRDAGTESGKRPRRGRYRQLLVQSLTNWSKVEQIQQALYMLDIGNFRPAAQMWNAMRRDDHVVAVTDSLVDGIFSLPVEIRPPPGHTEDTAKLAAQLVTERWSKMWPQGEASRIFAWGLQLGVDIFEKLWSVDATSSGQRLWTPSVKAWDMMFSWWNIGTRSYWMTTDPTGSETQEGSAEVTVEIPEAGDDHWGVFAPNGANEPWMNGIIRALAIPWLLREWGLRDWARFNEVFAIPARIGYIPEDADADQKELFIAQLQSMGNEPVIELPVRDRGQEQFDYKIVQATISEGGVAAFSKLLEYLDTAIAILMLGQNLTTNVKGGSHAAAKVHENIRADKIERHTNSLEQLIHDQLMVPFMVYNFGPQYAEIAPWARFIVDPPEDTAQKADTYNKLATSLGSFRDAGAPVDVPAVLDQFGVPRKSDEEIEGDEQALPQGSEDNPHAQQKKREPGADRTDHPSAPGGGAHPMPKHMTALAAQKLPRAHSTSVRGQAFVDDVVDKGKAAMARLMRGDLRELLAAIDGATSYEDARHRVLKAYGSMLPEIELRELLENAMTLGQLAGRTTIREKNR
jgi:phage gp29-like protein